MAVIRIHYNKKEELKTMEITGGKACVQARKAGRLPKHKKNRTMPVQKGLCIGFIGLTVNIVSGIENALFRFVGEHFAGFAYGVIAAVQETLFV